MKITLILALIGMTLILSGCREDQATIPKVTAIDKKEDITTTIKKRLDSTQELKGTSIYPHIQDNKTLLSGIVQTKKQKFLASTIARSVKNSGVVVNRLVVQ